ncbi:desulfoferrodoxin [Sporanaerobium hydrogeniformans]|uniref:Desulfoferrodoxin n=1 Tax=Sporanaerobium hydrogeniformans TaxID=3072179 RepID=A0AC61DGJ8_9FIRM|nr:desulfoferrodoxin family protein [Sporanaerobium hydrogeniformans]PHV71993.1 desulfoferrodoxin [Sporanaerobium hydrogeniformans]
MSGEQKFYRCKVCGNIVGIIEAGGGKLVCCNEAMTEIKPNTTEAATEKHLPVVSITGNEVKVVIGSVAHPMTEAHLINWVYLLTEKGGQRKCLSPNDEPCVTFALTEDDRVLAAFAYCNLHGLWKTEV